MKIRSKAPLRLGLAGGGSDLSPYCDIYGGYILNATINLFVHCTIEERNDGKIQIIASDLEENQTFQSTDNLPLNGIDELESHMILFFTGASRSSAKIIDEQIKNTLEGNTGAIEAMHRIKQSSID